MPMSQRFRPVSEGRRERETFRYDPSLIAQAVHNDLDNLIPPAELRASPDPALTAFAELAVLRLKTSRALISLFDRNYQYIVAEATPSLPLTPCAAFADHGVGEHLVLCGTAIPRAAGICELALGISRSPPPRDSAGSDDVPITIIPDLAADPGSSQRAFCHLAPENRFYTGVPLRTPRGIDIGVLCVFDSEPRRDLDNISICFLRDLSQVIVDYLESRRQRKSHRHAHRMVRGVGRFVEGKGTISEEKVIKGPASFGDDPPQEGGIDNVRRQVQRAVELQSPGISTSCSSPPAQLELGGLLNKSGSQSPPLRRPGPTPIYNANSSDATTTTGRSVSYFARTHPEEPQIQSIFSKATNVIREAIDVDQVLFLEASIRSFGGLAESTSYAAKSPGDRKSSSSSSDEMEHSQGHHIGNRSQGKGKSSCRVLGFSSPSTSSIYGDPPTQAFSSVSEGFLTKLLRRYPKGKIFNFNAKGNIQSSDDSGDETNSGSAAVEPSEASIAAPERPHRANLPRERSTRRTPPLDEAKWITATFPDARSVAIVPLWDTQKHRWYAGGFVCSTNPARTFALEHELSYLRAFGIVIMSKVDHLKAQLIERSKTDLLSSLSHELRSPLHGIILGAELLDDTSLDNFQREMLASIELCGRTLLETMDHLLELSKINNFIGPSPHRQGTEDATAPSSTRGFHHQDVGDGGEKLGIEAGMMRIASNVEIDVLVEEVVESVCAGFSYQRQSIADLVNDQSTERAEAPGLFRRLDSMQTIQDVASEPRKREDLLMLLGDVAVTFDIDPAVSWTFYAQSGAIRRIVMNLMGNSLKFTSKGTVNVSVVQLVQEEGKLSTSTSVKLIVTDTGRGISENYLYNDLFSPFCQEDSSTAGLGLGLSLVNQIVANLGGSVQVLSKLGKGTKVTVNLPLQGAASSSPPTGNLNSASFDEFETLAGELKGLRVRLLGIPTEHDVHGDGDTDWLKDMRSEYALLANFCAEWLRMHIIEESDSRQLPADVIVTTEASLEELLAEQSHGGISAPVVVICRNALVSRQLATSAIFTKDETILEFVSQPIGPRKLAKILLRSLRRWIKLQASTISSPTTSSLDHAEATPSSLASDAGISLKSEVEYFCKSVKKAETFASPATADLIAQGLQREETAVRRTARVDYAAKENKVQCGGLPERLKEDYGPISMPAPPIKSAQELDASRPSFLLVEDNPINLRILISYVKKLGYRFACATNGLEAVEAFQESRGQGAEGFKFVLMDISMPVMDGFEATRRIRALEMARGLSRCHIFALTGLASASAQQEAFASGIDLFLTKPVRLKELSKILESNSIL